MSQYFEPTITQWGLVRYNYCIVDSMVYTDSRGHDELMVEAGIPDDECFDVVRWIVEEDGTLCICCPETCPLDKTRVIRRLKAWTGCDQVCFETSCIGDED